MYRVFLSIVCLTASFSIIKAQVTDTSIIAIDTFKVEMNVFSFVSYKDLVAQSNPDQGVIDIIRGVSFFPDSLKIKAKPSLAEIEKTELHLPCYIYPHTPDFNDINYYFFQNKLEEGPLPISFPTLSRHDYKKKGYVFNKYKVTATLIRMKITKHDKRGILFNIKNNQYGDSYYYLFFLRGINLL